jgi:N-succinyldiaminopimelate aminotransferase
VIESETQAIRRAFSVKRAFLLDALGKLGVAVDLATEGGFYVWGSVANLPDGLNDGMAFFQKALEQKVITVPGQFFDINPGNRRHGRASRFERHVRFSFGPRLDVLETAVERLGALIRP